jgi:hypothetical protein
VATTVCLVKCIVQVDVDLENRLKDIENKVSVVFDKVQSLKERLMSLEIIVEKKKNWNSCDSIFEAIVYS